MGYTVREAAEKLGVTTGRVRQWIAAGRLAASPVHSRLSEISARELTRFSRIPRRAGRPKKKFAKSC